MRRRGLALALVLPLALSAGCRRTADGAREDAKKAAREAEEAARDAAREAEKAARETEKAAHEARKEIREAMGEARGAAREARSAVREAGRDVRDAKQILDVRAALALSQDVTSSGITVRASEEGRTLFLEGTVPTAAEKATAERIAREKADGYRVSNRLRVVAAR